MTLPDQGHGRKARRRGPGPLFFLIIAAAAIWCGGWFWLKAQVEQRMDAAVAQAAGDGYGLRWASRKVSGFPFRMNVELTDVAATEPSGWAVTIPRLKGEAFAYAIHHWVVLIPEGLTFTRPDGGAVIVTARALRASLTDFDQKPPRIAVEGVDLAFTPEAGAKPYFLSAARTLNARIIPGPDDQGGVLLLLGGTRMALEGLAARATEGGLVDFELDLTLSRVSGFQGRSWADAARSWTGSGGVILVRKASVSGGAAVLKAEGGTLTVGPDGRLQGDLDAELGDIAGQGQPLRGRVTLTGGEARLGPLVIGPAPRLF
ncbi:MAG: DUF2125 domain-containing protein [Caulobacter sp.]